MEKWTLPIDADRFRQTNAPWNKLMLNAPWSVGYVSQLISLKTFHTKEQWAKFYFEMGRYRKNQLQKIDPRISKILEDEQLIRTHRSYVKTIHTSYININTLNGRTDDDLRRKGQILYQEVHDKIDKITEQECYEAVKFRVLGETWNGIVLREQNTLATLQTHFPTCIFKKQSGAFDYEYAIDFEMYQNDKLICGIQIKPKSYSYKTPYIQKAKKTNARKNTLYTNTFNVPVFTVMSSSDGKVFDVI